MHHVLCMTGMHSQCVTSKFHKLPTSTSPGPLLHPCMATLAMQFHRPRVSILLILHTCLQKLIFKKNIYIYHVFKSFQFHNFSFFLRIFFLGHQNSFSIKFTDIFLFYKHLWQVFLIFNNFMVFTF